MVRPLCRTEEVNTPLRSRKTLHRRLFALLIVLYDKADGLLEILAKSAHTEKIQKADNDRNAVYRGLYDVVKASRRLLAVASKDAAERLFILLSTYRKKIVRSSYAEASSAIYNLLQDLQGTFAADITLLGFGKWVTDMEAAEENFQTLYEQRTQESVDKPKEHLRDVRKQVDAYYRSISEILYARLLADGLGDDVVVDPNDLKTGPYEDGTPEEEKGNITYNFVLAWNEVLKKYHTMLAARAGRKGKEKDPELEDDSDQPKED
jgi:hypothetical protein